MDPVLVLARVSAHEDRTPGPSHEIQAADLAMRQNKVDRRLHIPHGDIRTNDRRVVGRWLVELRRACRPTVAPQVHEVYVVPLPRDVIHPGFAIDTQVERTRRGLRCAMDVKHCSLASELGHSGRMLIADEQSNSGVAGVDHVVLRCKCRPRRPRGKRTWEGHREKCQRQCS